eukprot:TRINITY_DN2351_c0_g1_i1.p1 TRINITY_DN2351_c0_g1~~TRINITY_DN2351_c0_g1_i1.p1  ORF type:complete len:225 (-),score=47.81 TRINITY_DN2351_c0_g1_i1:772-1446(-)
MNSLHSIRMYSISISSSISSSILVFPVGHLGLVPLAATARLHLPPNVPLSLSLSLSLSLLPCRLQPVHDTQQRQVELWSSLVISYCRFHNLFTLDLQEAANTPLFHNERIDRRLQLADARVLLTAGIVEQGLGVWCDEDRTRLRVYWRTPSEWAKMIYTWAEDRGLIGTVCTVFEVLQGEESEGQAFHAMDRDVFNDAIAELCDNEQAQMLWGNTSAEDGVKFL